MGASTTKKESENSAFETEFKYGLAGSDSDSDWLNDWLHNTRAGGLVKCLEYIIIVCCLWNMPKVASAAAYHRAYLQIIVSQMINYGQQVR